MPKKNNWVKPFTYVLVLFVVPLLAYYLIYVQSREDALIDRTYSHLTNIATRTEARFNSIPNVIRNACKSPGQFESALETNDIGLTPGYNEKYEDSCDFNQEELEVTSLDIDSRDTVKINYNNILVNTNTNKLVGDIDISNRFYDIFIFGSDGKVIYQKHPENGRIGNSNELKRAIDKDEEGKSLISDPLESLRVNFHGQWYLMPSQPLRININQDDQQNWHMVGLIEESQFNREKLKFQSDTVAWVVLLIAVIVLIGPFLKVWYLGRFESFQKLDVVLLIASGFTLCSLLTIVIIHLGWRAGLNDFMETNLRSMAEEMAGDIEKEVSLSVDELTHSETYMQTAFSEIDGRVFEGEKDCPFLAGKEKNTETDLSLRGNLLKKPVNDYKPKEYPFFNMVYLLDQSGCQIIKWSTHEQPTNALQLENRIYYQRSRPNMQAPSRLYSLNGKEFFIEFITSRTTGERSVAISKPIGNSASDKLDDESSPREACLNAKPPKSEPSTSEKSVPVPCVAVMTTPLFRVFQSVLPHGFGFAVVDKSGNILVHHEGVANTEFNLTEELGDGSLLRRALFSGSEDQFITDYHGNPHKFLISPLGIEGADFYLVSFYSISIALKPLLEAMGTTIIAWLIWFSVLFFVALTLWQCKKFLYKNRPYEEKDSGEPSSEEKESEESSFRKNAVAIYEKLLLLGTVIAIALALYWPAISLIAPIYIVIALMWWLFRVSNNLRSKPFFVVVISWVLILSATSLPAFGLFRLIQQEAFDSFLQLQLFDQKAGRAAQQQIVANWLAKAPAPVDGQDDAYAKFRKNNAELSCWPINDPESVNRFQQVWKQYSLITTDVFCNIFKSDQPTPVSNIKLKYNESNGLDRFNPWRQMLGKLPDYSDNSLRLHAMYRNPGEISSRFNSVYLDYGEVSLSDETVGIRKLAQSIYQKEADNKISLLIEIYGLIALFGLIFMIILGAALWFLLVRTLGLRTENYRRVFDYTIPNTNQGSRDLIYGMSEFTKRIYFTGEDSDRIIWIDLRVDSQEEIEEKLTQIFNLPAENEPAERDIVILDHFDDHLVDQDVVISRINLLEELVRKKKVSVVVLLAVDPLSFVTATYDADQQAYMITRLASVMVQFNTCYYQEERPGPSKPESDEVKRTLWEECYHPNLQDIYYSIRQSIENRASNKNSSSAEKPLNRQEVIQLVKNRANAIYHHMWNLCSHAEKIMLVELAHGNLVNPNNWDLARRLKQRGYLRRDPTFHHIFNESFKQFILRMEKVDKIEVWRKESASTWENIRAPLFVMIIGAIIFIAFTQPSFFNSVFAFAAAGTASLPFLVNLIMARLKSEGGK